MDSGKTLAVRQEVFGECSAPATTRSRLFLTEDELRRVGQRQMHGFIDQHSSNARSFALVCRAALSAHCRLGCVQPRGRATASSATRVANGHVAQCLRRGVTPRRYRRRLAGTTGSPEHRRARRTGPMRPSGSRQWLAPEGSRRPSALSINGSNSGGHCTVIQKPRRRPAPAPSVTPQTVSICSELAPKRFHPRNAGDQSAGVTFANTPRSG